MFHGLFGMFTNPNSQLQQMSYDIRNRNRRNLKKRIAKRKIAKMSRRKNYQVLGKRGWHENWLYINESKIAPFCCTYDSYENGKNIIEKTWKRIEKWELIIIGIQQTNAQHATILKHHCILEKFSWMGIWIAYSSRTRYQYIRWLEEEVDDGGNKRWI